MLSLENDCPWGQRWWRVFETVAEILQEEAVEIQAWSRDHIEEIWAWVTIGQGKKKQIKMAWKRTVNIKHPPKSQRCSWEFNRKCTRVGMDSLLGAFPSRQNAKSLLKVQECSPRSSARVCQRRKSLLSVRRWHGWDHTHSSALSKCAYLKP